MTRFVLVSCSGPDGSGKTTLARDAVAHLRAQGHDATYHWMRLGSSPVLELVKKIAPAERESAGDAGPATYKATLGRRPLLRRVWTVALVADYLARVWGKVLRARLRGGVHVVDRYVVDAAVDLRAVYGFERAGILLRVTPKPRVRALVTAEGVDLTKRGDTPADPALLERSVALYTAWGEYFTHRLDTAGDREENGRALADVILEAGGRG